MKQVLSLASQVGPLLQSARKSMGLTQAQLAARLHISQSRMSAMELDPASIRLDQLLTLCAALHIELVAQTKPGAKAQFASTAATQAPW
jgi:HTH-type transcriptional regulator/antitoxin HipB